ncbi:hypothetical protein ACFQZ1_08500 [Bacillus sp. CGMCC 1.60114]|uniref:hypothetical protein n=1 Tax=unclassified Bacillus (in: firmicutes) TaxID=185979 RepID=UPI003634450C
MSKEKSEHEKMLDSLTPEQREELEKLKQEALEEPPSFLEYIEGMKRNARKDEE